MRNHSLVPPVVFFFEMRPASAPPADPRRPDDVKAPPSRPRRPEPDPSALLAMAAGLAAMVWRHPAAPWVACLGTLSSAVRWNGRTGEPTMLAYAVMLTVASFAMVYNPTLAAVPLFGRKAA